MVTPIDGAYTNSSSGTNDGYYFVQTIEANSNIMYIDFATQKMVYLTSDIAENYDSEANASHLDIAVSSFFTVHDNLFCVGTAARGNTCIYALAKNGSERRILAELPDNATLKRGIASDGEYIYTTLDTIDATANMSRTLYKISLHDGTSSPLLDLTETDMLYGASNEMLYIKCTDINPTSYESKSELIAYSVVTNEAASIASWPGGSNCGAIANNQFYYLDFATSSLNAFDLTTHTSSVIAADLPIPEDPQNILFDAIRDNKFIYMTPVFDATDIYSSHFTTYAVDLTDGLLKEITLHGQSNDGTYLEILWETEKDFLVVYDRGVQKVSLPAADGTIYDSEIYTLTYALIDKADYFNNVPNYRVIENAV